MSEYLWAEDPPPSGPTQAPRAMSTFPTSDSSTPIVVVEADPSVRSRLAMQLGERAIALETLDGVEERFTSPFLLVLGPSCSLAAGRVTTSMVDPCSRSASTSSSPRATPCT